uniref:Uncharacterized protein n=1 Tax=Gasterosteus aculeatus aculeatus TaxID=481459 RepID=A0AAQ4R234_GASAC
MGCTSAKQVSAVPSDEEGHGKAYSNGDLFTDEYKMKGVEEVKYMRGEETRLNARNQENLSGISRLTTPKRCHLTAVDLRGCSSGTVGITATGRTPHGEGTSSPQARPRRVVGPGIGFLHSRSRCVLMWQETIRRGSKTWG